MSTFVRAAVLTNYLEVSQYLGLIPLHLLARVGLSKAQLQHPENRIPVEATVRLLEDSAAESGCQSFGLSMAESRQLSDLGVISLLLPHQRTLRDALLVLVQYRQLMNNAVAMHIEEAGKMVIIREEVITHSPTDCRQANELAIGVLFRLCAVLLGTHWHPSSVHFTHPAPDNLLVHRRLFNCNLVFDSEFNGIVCPDANLDRANPHANPAIARYAQRYLDSLQSPAGPSILFEVRNAIYLRLPMGRASIEQIAQAQGLNVRTLQRRLKDEGYVFNTLVSEARRDLVLRYIDNSNYSLERIADMLGFSVATSLTRWFISQFGMSPSAWRSLKKNARQSARMIHAQGAVHTDRV